MREAKYFYKKAFDLEKTEDSKENYVRILKKLGDISELNEIEMS